ncbi:unnamed protein product [Dracunculus medinensis]|uniref:GPI transamidase component PIG-S n=1 Tax=Dracunculus medinensis TaxID=318479 RepID=A0A3P7SMP0_DRAME|nr:unnamed protein product [Dracunculus medinensis]
MYYISMHYFILPYRQLSAFSFVLIIIIFGIPLWWQTTSTYRAKFKNFPTELDIILPVFYPSNISFNLLRKSTCSVKYNENLYFKDSPSDINGTLNDDRFHVQMLILDSSEWRFLENVIHFSAEYLTYILYDANDEKLFQRLFISFVNILLDRGHLKAIVNRDLRHRMDPREIAMLPPSEQKRFVWDSTALNAEYIIQIIFIHSTSEASKYFEPNNIILNINRFALTIANVTKLRVSSEHLWDFDISSWITKDASDRWLLSVNHLSTITTQLILFDHSDSGNIAKSMAIASWGAVVASNDLINTSISHAMIASLRVLFGLDSDLPYQFNRCPSPLADWELERLKLRAFVDCAMNGISSVRAMHMLVAEIDNIVISDEIADTVNQAVDLIMDALKQAKESGKLDLAKVIKGRELAERAINDQSLLALLYFPSDQKFAVYLPLFLPILLPLIGSLMSLYKYFCGKLYW